MQKKNQVEIADKPYGRYDKGEKIVVSAGVEKRQRNLSSSKRHNATYLKEFTRKRDER